MTESEQAVQDKRIADATVALAKMTSLAIATAAAVIVPLIQRANELKQARRVALGQVRQIPHFYMDRTSDLNTFPNEDADTLYGALFSAHGAIARAIN